jgi:hypothetical protein
MRIYHRNSTSMYEYNHSRKKREAEKINKSNVTINMQSYIYSQRPIRYIINKSNCVILTNLNYISLYILFIYKFIYIISYLCI